MNQETFSESFPLGLILKGRKEYDRNIYWGEYWYQTYIILREIRYIGKEQGYLCSTLNMHKIFGDKLFSSEKISNSAIKKRLKKNELSYLTEEEFERISKIIKLKLKSKRTRIIIPELKLK